MNWPLFWTFTSWVTESESFSAQLDQQVNLQSHWLYTVVALKRPRQKLLMHKMFLDNIFWTKLYHSVYYLGQNYFELKLKIAFVQKPFPNLSFCRHFESLWQSGNPFRPNQAIDRNYWMHGYRHNWPACGSRCNTTARVEGQDFNLKS